MNNLKTERILLISSDDQVFFKFNERFQLEGFNVIQASNFKEAFYKINNEKFKLIITNYKIDSKTVLDLFHKLSLKNQLNSGAPTFLMEGKIKKEQIQLIARNISGVFLEPISTQEVVNKILNIISKK